MHIKFITPELHVELKAIAETHPDMVFQNEGYQYVSTETYVKHAKQFARVTEILKEHVVGFVRFFNFRMDTPKGGGDPVLVLRLDYNWGEADGTRYFVGVGYVTLDELRDGFTGREFCP